MWRRAGTRELYSSAWLHLHESDIADFLRYRSGERRRRRALIHGLQEEESRADGLRGSIRTKGATLKYKTPSLPHTPPPLPPSSLTALRPGQSVRQGGSGEEGAKAAEDEERSPLAGLIQSPIPSRLAGRGGPGSPCMRTTERLHRGNLVRGARLSPEIHTAEQQ